MSVRYGTDITIILYIFIKFKTNPASGIPVADLKLPLPQVTHAGPSKYRPGLQSAETAVNV